MIVVPALPHGENGEEPVVAGIVAGNVTPAPDDMGERIDAERRVVDRNRAPEKADDEPGPAGGEETREREGCRRRELIAMEPQELGITCEISHSGEIRCRVSAGENPAEMTVEESRVARRMDVELGVGIEVVVAVVGRPPQNALLRGALRHHGENELKDAARLIGAMREVAVIAGPDRKRF